MPRRFLQGLGGSLLKSAPSVGNKALETRKDSVAVPKKSTIVGLNSFSHFSAVDQRRKQRTDVFRPHNPAEVHSSSVK